MPLSPEKEATMNRLNAEAIQAHQVEAENARLKGRAAPPPPVPLTPIQMEYPKWLFHATKKAVMVADEAAHKALGAEWVESPADVHKAVETKAPEAKAPEAKKPEYTKKSKD